jgi:WD40 repeat protein
VSTHHFDKIVRLWNSHTNKAWALPADRHTQSNIIHLDLSTDGRYLVTGARDDGTVRIWNIKAGTFKELSAEVSAVAISADNKYVLTVSDNYILCLWDVEADHSQLANVSEPMAHDTIICILALSPDGMQLAAGYHYSGVGIWDMQSWTSRLFLITEDSPVGIAWSPDGKFVAMSDGDIPGDSGNAGIRVWDTDRGGLQFEQGWWGYFSPRYVAFSPDGKYLAAGGFNYPANKDNLFIWEVGTWRTPFGMFPTGTSEVLAVQFSPDSRTLVSADRFGRVRAWSLEEVCI